MWTKSTRYKRCDGKFSGFITWVCQKKLKSGVAHKSPLKLPLFCCFWPFLGFLGQFWTFQGDSGPFWGCSWYHFRGSCPGFWAFWRDSGALFRDVFGAIFWGSAPNVNHIWAFWGPAWILTIFGPFIGVRIVFWLIIDLWLKFQG